MLEKLKTSDIVSLLKRAMRTLDVDIMMDKDLHGQQSQEKGKVFVQSEALTALADLSDGDARNALNGLQLAIQTKRAMDIDIDADPDTELSLVTLKDIKSCLQRTHLLYDRVGDEHYHCISALHKSMRGSDANASLYWLARMLCGGEDPLYVARRVIRFASEDIGMELLYVDIIIHIAACCCCCRFS